MRSFSERDSRDSHRFCGYVHKSFGKFSACGKSTLPLRKRIILRSIVSPHERKLMSVTKPSISTQELEMHFNVIPLPQNEITVLQVLIFMLSLS